jgi:hypothetical protein
MNQIAISSSKHSMSHAGSLQPKFRRVTLGVVSTGEQRNYRVLNDLGCCSASTRGAISLFFINIYAIINLIPRSTLLVDRIGLDAKQRRLPQLSIAPFC